MFVLGLQRLLRECLPSFLPFLSTFESFVKQRRKELILGQCIACGAIFVEIDLGTDAERSFMGQTIGCLATDWGDHGLCHDSGAEAAEGNGSSTERFYFHS